MKTLQSCGMAYQAWRLASIDMSCTLLLALQALLQLMPIHVQDAEVKMNRVLEASQQTHWAAFLLDSSLSRTRRMKGLILQLFCEHWSINAALLKDPKALHSICSSNGLQLSRRKDEKTSEGGNHGHLKMDRKRKAKRSKRHKKRKKRRSPDTTESEDMFEFETDQSSEGALMLDRDLEVWDLEFGPYKGSCAAKDAAEMITSICACVRYQAYVTAQA